MKTRRPTKLIVKARRQGIGALNHHECCRLLSWHLERVYEWEQMIWDRIWGSGGGGTPPPPPKWPPA
jgi:hypothetical protein